MEAADASPLGPKLERALLHELGQTWAELNQNHFRRQLRRPVFALSDSPHRLGAWDSRARTLSLSRRLVLDCPWTVVREVLKHEVAHQFVDEVLGVRDQPAHGPAFESVCRAHGFDGRAAGMPAASGIDGGGSPILRRIARLLALAESPNVHEAATAMRAAQRLMLRHNIDAATAAAHEGYTFRHVGVPSGRVSGSEHVLAGILSRHFFVDVIWIPSYLPREGRSGRVLELCGTPSNLEVAVYVHGFLMTTGERLWREHQRAHNLTANAERRRFILGVMIGFDEKLKSSTDEDRREGLVWTGDPALTTFLAKRYPRRTGGSGIGVRPNETYEHGRHAGHTIVLHKPITSTSTSNSHGRLLPAPSR